MGFNTQKSEFPMSKQTRQVEMDFTNKRKDQSRKK